MASKLAPPSKSSSAKKTTPKKAISKIDLGETVALNLKIPAGVKKEFKQYALEHDFSTVSSAFIEMFEFYKNNQ